jgi:hypothetical protein
VATSTPTPVTPTLTPTASATTGPLLVVNPAADAFVDANAPATNYGANGLLRTRRSPEQRSYLRFNVSGLAGQVVTRATLRLYANGSSGAGYTLAGVPDNSWSETAINYNNKPALGGALASLASHGGAMYTSVDVTGYITGDGTYSFALTTTSTKAVSYPSREAGSNRPELVIELAPAGGSAASTVRARAVAPLEAAGAALVGMLCVPALARGRRRRR